jgi:chromosomal replication initiator protein
LSSESESKDLVAAWSAATSRIQTELGWLHTRSWLSELRPQSLEKDRVCLEAGSTEIRASALEHVELIKAALSEAIDRKVRLRFVLSRRRAPTRKKTAPSEPDLILGGQRVNPANLLSSFMSGGANLLPARFAAEAVKEPGRWHPLVYVGESGSGKTHLLQGIVNGTRRKWPNLKVVYTSGDRFTRHYVLCMRRRDTTAFREFYRGVNLLVIDDVQELAGKPGTERELCFTLDHLADQAQVVLSSSVHPKMLGFANPGLEGRLLGGQVVSLRSPDPAARSEIIRARCAEQRIPIEAGVVEFLSDGVDLSARELISALTRLHAHHRLVGTRLDEHAVRLILADVIEQKLRPASLEGVAEFVAERMGLRTDQLRGRSRKPTVVRARQLAMALCRELTLLTLREVGGYFGERSCACVHSAQQLAAGRLEADGELATVWGDASRRFVRPSA